MTDPDPGWRSSPRALFALLMVSIMVVSVAAPVIAATTDDPITDHLVLGGHDEVETVTNLYQNGTLNTSQQDLAEGTTHEAIAGYEDDNGDWVPNGNVEGGGDFEVNTTHDINDGTNVNPYIFPPGHIVDSSYTAFPDKASNTWSNASGWVEVTGASNGTVTNTTVNADVDGVRFDTASNGDSASGQVIVYKANYSKWDGELDTDEDKRVLQLAMDIDTLDANTRIEFRVYDESGSYKEVFATNDQNVGDDSTIFASGTGDYVYQIKLNQLPTNGSDTTFQNIENVTVQVNRTSGSTGDADFTISWLDLRKKSKNVLGEQRATTDDDGNDGDGDGDWDEFQTHYNATNNIRVYSMETLDSEYDDAVVNDLQYPARYEADGLDEQGPDGNYAFYWEDPSNPSFDDTLNLTVALEAPSAVDLSYTNWETVMIQKWPESRYLTIESASGVSSSTNLSQASFSSDSSSLGSQESTVTIDASTSAGERILLHVDLQLTADERANLETTADAGGAPPPSEGAGGFLGFGLLGDIAAGIALIGSFFVGIPQRIWRGIFG